MASQEDVKMMVELLDTINPSAFLKRINEINAGIGAVMRYLHESNEPVTAGQISNMLNISTARVAVLLKKMAAKDLIIKETGPHDARTTLVRLSPHGAEQATQMLDDLYSQIGELIDQIGTEQLCEYVVLTQKIHNILAEPPFELIEQD